MMQRLERKANRVRGWRGLKLVALDPFDSVTANLTTTGEWSRPFGTAVIGEDGVSAFSNSTVSTAIYLNTRNGMSLNRWVRCLVTSSQHSVVAGLVVWANVSAAARVYVQVIGSTVTGLDEFTLIERYSGIDLPTLIGTLAGNNSPRLITVSVVGREINIDIDNGALTLVQDLAGGTMATVPTGRCGLYYNNTTLSAGHAAEWDDFEVRLYPYS